MNLPQIKHLFRVPRCLLHGSMVALLVASVAGCRSTNHVVLENRPSWVNEAEQRLQQRPVASVEQAEGPSSRAPWGSPSGEPASQSTEPASQPREQNVQQPQQRPSTTARRSAPPATAPTASPPPNITWGETRITVEVEQ